MPETHRNNFDFIRLFAALMVIFGHSYDLNGRHDTPLALWTNYQTAEHGIGVLAFFAISGFLICRSFVKRGNPVQFLKSRLLRIIPGLAVAVLLTVFVLGPLVTSASLAEYFSDEKTWKYLKNILPWNIKYQLPGVFQHNAHGANGSLWTIPLELRCYLGVLLLGVFRVLKFRVIMAVIFAALLVAYWTGHTSFNVQFYIMFLSGAVFYLYEDKLPRRWFVALACFIGLLVAGYYGVLLKAMPVFGTYLVICIAYLEKLKLYRLTKYGDFSYGVYIYAFPIQQLLIHLHNGRMSPVMTFIYVVPPVMVCAVLSWFLIEKPALSYKKEKILAA